MEDETTAVVLFDRQISDLVADAYDPTDDQVFALLRGYDYPVQVGVYKGRAAVWAIGQDVREFQSRTQEIAESVGLSIDGTETYADLEAMWDADGSEDPA